MSNYDLMNATFREKLLIYTSPILLIAIACLQLYLAHTQHLTAWKGGGFGMFSTVDSSGARFFRVFFISSKETFPVEVPQHLRRIARKARAIPTTKNLDRLAQALLDEVWIPYEYDQFVENDLPQSKSPFKFLQDFLGQDNQSSHEKKDNDTLKVPNSYSSDLQPRLRTKEDFEHPRKDIIVQIHEVRLELWQIEFDPNSSILNASRLFQRVKSNSQ